MFTPLRNTWVFNSINTWNIRLEINYLCSVKSIDIIQSDNSVLYIHISNIYV